ncbi:hypothetical protein BKA67DRAFT_541767 [Truncatella angustata]|uniref:Uncharacterized protein n=1 Tax=Truncatella angustata TaxID=152316 RepID=A0A9P8UB56_9PEZI|nr:uncharacterized protein BKA67DRAFT_541767 [Truncatella angustata]KAH6645557.1 hypothetical protein BKA67DRAFT_541767 [Truncatella angustata]
MASTIHNPTDSHTLMVPMSVHHLAIQEFAGILHHYEAYMEGVRHRNTHLQQVIDQLHTKIDEMPDFQQNQEKVALSGNLSPLLVVMQDRFSVCPQIHSHQSGGRVQGRPLAVERDLKLYTLNHYFLTITTRRSYGARLKETLKPHARKEKTTQFGAHLVANLNDVTEAFSNKSDRCTYQSKY